MVFACVLINIGMWMERYIVIVPTQISPRLLSVSGQGIYLPTMTEALITVACFAGFTLLYAVFTRYFPIVPVWETAESLPAGHEAEPALQTGSATAD
jgi:molybdopterin-containing oxidoreductase family membrane subunit